jgi:hypothetical protein
MKYVSLPFNKKLNLLRAHSMGCDWVNLDEEQWCLHCGKKFTGHSARVWEDDEQALWLECGTPGCNGSPIDWAPYPWWDPKHPATKEYLRKPPPARKPLRKTKKSRGKQRADDDDIPF